MQSVYNRIILSYYHGCGKCHVKTHGMREQTNELNLIISKT